MRNLGFVSIMVAAGLGGATAQPAKAQSAYSSGGLVYCYPTAGGYAPAQAEGPRATPELWRSYAPGSAWTTSRYDVTTRQAGPSALWQSYSSSPVAGAFQSRGQLQGSDQPISSMNLEYGTGRSVGMIKPWLPSGVD